MEKFYKVLSLVLHPVFLPSIGAGVYLFFLPLPLYVAQKYLVFFIVLGATFVVPVLTLFLLKFTGYVKTNDAETIEERKLPVVLMIVNYLFLAVTLQEIWQLKELTILAYSTAVGLIVTSILFYTQTKVSLHMLGITGVLGFTLIYGGNYQFPSIIIALLIVFIGLLATARLQLKAHNIKEVLIGGGLGLFVPVVLNFVL